MHIGSIDPSLRQLAQEIASEIVNELWARLRRGETLIAPEYVSPKQATQLTGVSVKTLESMRGVRKGPPYYKVGGRVRYKIDDLRAWIESGGPVE